MDKIVISIAPTFPNSKNEFDRLGCGTVSITIENLPLTRIASLSNLPIMIAQHFRDAAKLNYYPESQVENMLQSILARGQGHKETCVE